MDASPRLGDPAAGWILFDADLGLGWFLGRRGSWGLSRPGSKWLVARQSVGRSWISGHSGDRRARSGAAHPLPRRVDFASADSLRPGGLRAPGGPVLGGVGHARS